MELVTEIILVIVIVIVNYPTLLMTTVKRNLLPLYIFARDICCERLRDRSLVMGKF